jgi:hypothetical protein
LVALFRAATLAVVLVTVAFFVVVRDVGVRDAEPAAFVAGVFAVVVFAGVLFLAAGLAVLLLAAVLRAAGAAAVLRAALAVLAAVLEAVLAGV